MLLFYLSLALAVIFAAVFTIRRGTKTDAVSLLLKTIASLCFILLAVTGVLFGFSDSSGILIITGLVCGLIGDIFLDLKFVYPQDAVLHTFSGFGAFMLGHVFYYIFVFTAYSFRTTGLLIALAAGVLIGIVIFVTPKLMKLDYGRYRVISSVYAGLLVSITVYALYLELATGASASKLLFFIGLVLFLISDLILSQIYFGKDKNTTMNKILNHATYYAGQILIASSTVLLGMSIMETAF